MTVRNRRSVAPWPDRALERDACGIGFVADVTGCPDRHVVDLGLTALARLRHRGAFGSDERTGDGAGVLVPIPRRLMARDLRMTEVAVADLGLLMLFICDRRSAGEVIAAVEEACAQERLKVIHWRDVPVEPSALGSHANATRPRIFQAVLRAPGADMTERSEQRAHRARRRVEAFARGAERDVHVASCSFATVTYKALAAADRLSAFYPDLRDTAFEAPFMVFHQRYSTNTSPSWERAQPFRMVCHNGEINTIAGNANRMRAREGRLGLDSAAEEALFRPAFDERASDSGIIDEVVELLSKEGGPRGTGRDIRRVLAMLVPPAWEEAPDLDDDRRAFYRWHASLMEPWDGPAALIFTDGVAVGATLDRNGLRPLRYWASDDGLVVCASEAGVIDLPGGTVRRGKVGPGQILVVDPRTGGLDEDALRPEIGRLPWKTWVETFRTVRPRGSPRADMLPPDELLARQIMHGYTREDLSLVLRPAAAQGHESTFSMGDDAPIAALSRHDRSLFNHLRQRFAQVTNPAMDHIRERSVMSFQVLLGAREPLLKDVPEAAALEELESFFLWDRPAGAWLDATWDVEEGSAGMRTAIRRLAEEAVGAVEAPDGARLLVVSDLAAGTRRAPIPSVLAVGAVNAALTRAGLRTRCSVLAEVDDARESHHAACLLAVGAEAIRMRLAAASVAALARASGAEGIAVEAAMDRYREAVEDGVRKAMAKLGISCVESYRGAEAVDLLGVDDEIASLCFVSTRPALVGVGFDDVAAAVLDRHTRAYASGGGSLANPGYVKFHRGGEPHATAPVRGSGGAPRGGPRAGAAQDHGGRREGPGGRRATRGRAAGGPCAQPRVGATRPSRALREVRGDRARPRSHRRARPVGAARRGVVGSPARGGAGLEHPAPLLHGRDLARLDLGRGARDAGARHERDRRHVQHRRGRRGSRPLPHAEELEDQADRIGTLRGHARVLRIRAGAPDQDRAGVEARRRRTAARQQGHARDRTPAAYAARVSR